MGCHRRDLSGQRFGRLLALHSPARDRHHNRLWLCRCDCGTEKLVKSGALTGGNTASCGCLHREVMTPHGATVGGKRSPEYLAWGHMRRRCQDPQHPQFRNYGGRGIAVCERWQEFQNFLADMGARPSPRHSLDRIDNDGSYEPGNCRWATKDVQQHNRRARSNTGHRGISWTSRDKTYVWRVTRRGVRLEGRATSLNEAVAAYADARKRLYPVT